MDVKIIPIVEAKDDPFSTAGDLAHSVIEQMLLQGEIQGRDNVAAKMVKPNDPCIGHGLSQGSNDSFNFW
jgi:hypothetical protein